MAGPLKNPRREKFCQLCASGVKPVDAYISLGYSKNGAPQSASALLKNPEVSNRVREIQEEVSAYTVANVTFDRERVLARLDVLSRKAEAAEQYSAAAKCEELLGKHVGMWVERSVQTVWNGDVSSLTSDQLARLTNTFEQIAAEQKESLQDPSQIVN